MSLPIYEVYFGLYMPPWCMYAYNERWTTHNMASELKNTICEALKKIVAYLSMFCGTFYENAHSGYIFCPKILFVDRK